MMDVTARLGPGSLVYQNPAGVERGWYDTAGRVYLLVNGPGHEDYKRRGLSGAPPVVWVALIAERHKVPNLPVKTLGRPRLSLTSPQGPNGIRLGDPQERVLRVLGKEGQSQNLSGNTYPGGP